MRDHRVREVLRVALAYPEVRDLPGLRVLLGLPEHQDHQEESDQPDQPDHLVLPGLKVEVADPDQLDPRVQRVLRGLLGHQGYQVAPEYLVCQVQ